jgi:branched-chain amino acid transport system ATP-binding protein
VGAGPQRGLTVATTVKPLVVDNVSKSFGGLQALYRVSLSMETGERRAVLGPNGAGKSTLFNQISGIDNPTEGRIYLFGQDVTAMPAHRRTALGLARTFQITQLFPKLTLAKNLLLALQGLDGMKFSMLRPMNSYKRILTRVEELLDQWQLQDKQGVAVQDLSYGEQRQVEILLAMAQQPRLLLLDEPTAGLSPMETASVVKLIQRLPREVTILLIEHDMDVAFELVEMATVLHTGRVIAAGPCEEVRGSALVQEIYLGKKVQQKSQESRVGRREHEPA